MAHRVGVCRTCHTRFQIPASFAPRQAKCRNCGGVVEIGPLEGAPDPVSTPTTPAPAAPRAATPAPPPQPVRAPIPAPAPAPVPAAPARKSGLVRALLVAGIAAILAIGLWSLLA